MFSSIFLLSGCAKDDIMLENTTDADVIRQIKTYKISSETAIEQAKGFVSELNPSTRSVNRTVSDITLIGDKNKTRAGEDCDSLLYLINFADDEGFVLMSADVRSIPIYAISDKGNFVINDENREQMTGVIEGAKQNIKASIDTIKYTGNGHIPPWIGFQGWEKTPINYKIIPKLSEFQSRVSHNGAFSQYCRDDNGKPAQSGCVAVATEQILSYYQHPTYIDNRFISWENANSSNGTNTVARVLQLIGSKDYLKLEYHENGLASGKLSNVAPAITKLGYEHCGSFIKFFDNEDTAVNALEQGPILMYASSSKHEDAHLWVIDGMIQYKVDMNQFTIIGTPLSYTYPNLFHCAWGFPNGDCNGYYYADLYGFIGEPCYKDSTDPATNNNVINIYSDKDVRFLYGFLPKR